MCHCARPPRFKHAISLRKRNCAFFFSVAAARRGALRLVSSLKEAGSVGRFARRAMDRKVPRIPIDVLSSIHPAALQEIPRGILSVGAHPYFEGTPFLSTPRNFQRARITPMSSSLAKMPKSLVVSLIMEMCAQITFQHTSFS